MEYIIILQALEVGERFVVAPTVDFAGPSYFHIKYVTRREHLGPALCHDAATGRDVHREPVPAKILRALLIAARNPTYLSAHQDAVPLALRKQVDLETWQGYLEEYGMRKLLLPGEKPEPIFPTPGAMQPSRVDYVIMSW